MSLFQFPSTPRELLADSRWSDPKWVAPDGKTFYQLAEMVLGADAAADLWFTAMCLDVGRVA